MSSLRPIRGEPLPAVGHGVTAQSDLVPIYLLRYDRENTRRSYARDLAIFFGSDAVTLEMARAVSFGHVNEHLASLDADGRAPATMRRRLATLRGFFAWLVALGLLDLNPADRHLVRRISADRMQDRVITILTAEQSRALVDSVDMEKESWFRDQTLMLTLLHCVLRRSEAAGMDFEHLRRASDHWVLDLPRAKGGQNQTVKVPPHVAEQLLAIGDHYAYTSGPIWRSLSNNSRGRRLSGSAIYSIVHKHAQRAGLGDAVGAHTLRHTGCTLAIESGASVQQVQTHARHKNIETTMLYVHQRDKLGDSAADYIDF